MTGKPGHNSKLHLEILAYPYSRSTQYPAVLYLPNHGKPNRQKLKEV
jgi:hypothetical protein